MIGDIALMALLIAQDPSIAWVGVRFSGSGAESPTAVTPVAAVRAKSAAQLKRKMQRRPGMQSADLGAGFLRRLR
ncbi:hypothetical protein XaraCFBP7407_02810 [Xanthomonas arboricola pv. arracaciae]|nr:hypothetical protein XaraCFBP7407_02810 [Xanthomonas arboricola pv. arracaciae]